jgi:hypothetical protein
MKNKITLLALLFIANSVFSQKQTSGAVQKPLNKTIHH